MWEEHKILIVVKTYPEYSSKYTETVCTAGILADTKRFVRLYPVTFRYLTGDQQFKKYQWISTNIKKNSSDTRPESYKIDDSSIKLLSRIPSDDGWKERKKWVLNDFNLHSSLEDLLSVSTEKRTSLGLIKPAKIVDLEIKERSQSEMQDAARKKESIMRQPDMYRPKLDLEIMPVRFLLHFSCNSSKCHGHKISILDWEIYELYRKLRNQEIWEKSVRSKIIDEILSKRRDSYLIMGNMNARRHIFCILGFFWPPIENQPSLF